jgi:integrase
MEHPAKISDAPGLVWRPRSDHWVALWLAKRDAVKRGYPVKSVRLWPPSHAPLAELTADVVKLLQSECDRLQGEMIGWLDDGGGDAKDDVPAYNGTLAGLIKCYERDPDSPFAAIRYSTRAGYGRVLDTIERNVGGSDVRAIKARDVKRWFEKWAEPATPGGPRRLDKAHSLITMLRQLFRYGAALLECPECERLHRALAKLAFPKGQARSQALTREQAQAIIRAANADGLPSLALAQALAFELALRQRDVIGEWVPVSEPGLSGILDGHDKWQVGVHWEEVSPDLILTHRLSKSIRGRHGIADANVGKIKKFDLKLYPMVLEQLQHVPPERRVGPMVVCESTALPWRSRWFRVQWRRLAEQAGVPADVQNRDSRAGAITEAIEASGGDLDLARIGAGHSNVATTQRYSRADQRRTAELAKLRAKPRPEK